MNRSDASDEQEGMESLEHLSDEALVALAARGDEQALGVLYDRHGRLAYGVARRVLRDPQLAEDAVQEGFLNVWRQADRFRPDQSLAASWILMLVHRRAVDIVRREERRNADSLDAYEGYDVEAPGDAEGEALQAFEREWARQTLSRLPDPQREVIELAFFGGYTQSELSERLGVPLGTVKSRMFNGLARLRELLEEERWPTVAYVS